MIRELILPQELADQLILLAENGFPEEICGLVAGRNENAEEIIPVENKYHSQEKFYMEEGQLFQALLRIAAEKKDLLAIYHSHPHGPAAPSQTDINTYNYPDSLIIIVAKQEGHWLINTFEIEAENYHPVRTQYTQHRKTSTGV